MTVSVTQWFHFAVVLFYGASLFTNDLNTGFPGVLVGFVWRASSRKGNEICSVLSLRPRALNVSLVYACSRVMFWKRTAIAGDIERVPLLSRQSAVVCAYTYFQWCGHCRVGKVWKFWMACFANMLRECSKNLVAGTMRAVATPARKEPRGFQASHIFRGAVTKRTIFIFVFWRWWIVCESTGNWLGNAANPQSNKYNIVFRSFIAYLSNRSLRARHLSERRVPEAN